MSATGIYTTTKTTRPTHTAAAIIVFMLMFKQRLPNDVIMCGVYTYLGIINKTVRYFYDLELEELRQSQLRDNATLVESIRNFTNHPVYGLKAQLRTARWMLVRTRPRGRMCARAVDRTVGCRNPVLRNSGDRPPRYRSDTRRHRRQLKRARKLVRCLRHLRGLIRWQLIARGVSVSGAT